MAEGLHLSPRHREEIEALLREHVPEAEVWTYGSRVNGQSHDGSDLELVLRGPKLAEIDNSRLTDFIEALEDSTIPFLVEVRAWARLSKSFRREIEREYVVLVEREQARGPEHKSLVSVRTSSPTSRRSDMAGEWTERLLGELTDNFDATRVPVKQVDRRAGPYPYYGASGVVDHVDDYLFDGEYLLIAEDGENLRTRNTPIAFLVNGKFWVNNHAHIVRGNHKANTRYLMYALSELDISGYLTGSTMPKLTQGNMNRISLLTPPLPEQCAIAHILGTLDDKIELNRRVNETLEEMARALFKSWFVDFDPVRAKMEGRDPGLPRRLADLFPDQMVASELGAIPKGWEVADIQSLCVSITSGGTPTRGNQAFWEGGTIPWYKTGELHDGPLIDSKEYITETAICNSSAKLWPAGTILFALYASPTVGRLGVLTKPGTANQAAAGLIVKPEYGVPFLKHTLIEARGALKTIAVGAAQQNINQQVLKTHRIMVPSTAAAGCYSRLMATCEDQQAVRAKEIRNLTALRDTLLPKLVSGKLRVH